MSEDRWAEVERWFLASADLPPAGRSAFLNASCPAELRAEVEVLLAHDGHEDALVGGIVANAAQALQEVAGGIEAGQRIGPYRVIREIGQGGMGTVYEAVRDDEFHQRVAIKVVNRGMESGFVLDRFRRERQMLANLQHPNIARLLDGGTTSQGLPYFAMEYLEGRPLTEYSSPLSLPEKLDLFLQVCAAVEYAHSQLVIHRDLKPTNVLVTAKGIPKLLDFGIAKLVDEAASGDMPQFSGAMTPYYASPEQIRGEVVTTASDVYSLGALLYEMLCGRRPHEFPSCHPADIERILEEEGLVKPSAIVPRLPGDVDQIVLRALRREPRERYSSVEKLVEDIRRFRAWRPIQARETEARDRIQKFLRRNRLSVTATVALLATVLTGAAAVLYQARLAERRFTQLRHLANSFLFDFHDAIQRLPGSTAARAMVVNKALEYLQGLASESGGDPTLLAEVAASYERVGQVQGDPLHSNLGDSAGALASYRKAVAILEDLDQRRRIPHGVPNALIQAYDRLANLQRETHDSAGSLQTLRKAQALGEFRVSITFDPVTWNTLANVYSDIGRTLNVLEDASGAFEAARKSLALYQKLADEKPKDHKTRSDLAVGYAAVGAILLKNGKLAEALDYYRRNLALRRELSAESPLSVDDRRGLMLAYSHVGDTLGNPDSQNLGDPAGALAAYREMLAIAQELAGGDSSDRKSRYDLAMSYRRTGGAAAGSGDRAGALRYFRKSLDLTVTLLDSDPKNSALASNALYLRGDLGKLLAAGGDLAEGARSYHDAVQIGRQLIEQDPARAELRVLLARLYWEYAMVLARSGDRAAATSLEGQLLRLVDSLPARASIPALATRPRAYYALGEMHEQLRDRGPARAWFERSKAAWRELEQSGRWSNGFAGEAAAANEGVRRLVGKR